MVISDDSSPVWVDHNIRKGQGTVLADSAFSLRWRVRRATQRFRTTPDFMLIGMMRCGSSTVYRTLSNHHQVVPAFRKEIRYFDRNYDEGPKWYRGQFPLAVELRGKLTGDGSPTYLPSPGVELRVHESLGTRVKFVVLLRDPVVRAQSQWRVMALRKAELLSFPAALAEEDPEVAAALGLPHLRSQRRAESSGLSYIGTGEYARHLERWFAIFPRESFHIVRSEELFANFTSRFAEICRFLGLEPPDSVKAPHLGSSTGPALDQDVREVLTERFRKPNQRLADLIGPGFEWNQD